MFILLVVIALMTASYFQELYIRFLILFSTIPTFILLSLNKTGIDRFKVVSKRLPPLWEGFLKANSLYYPLLSPMAKKRFTKDIRILMAQLRIESTSGEETGWENRLFIAIGLATVLIGRPSWELPLPEQILLMPGDCFDENIQPGNGNYAAAATIETLYLTEQSLRISFGHRSDGYNNIFHEIAHYLDMEDGRKEGRPFIFRFHYKKNFFYSEWRKIFDREFERIKKGGSGFRSHATKSPSELFACATELFFESPTGLKDLSPNIYKLFLRFYNFDPIGILHK